MKISVCVPCFENHLNFINHFIKQINMQSLLPHELVFSISGIYENQQNDIISSAKQIIDPNINLIINCTINKHYAGGNRNLSFSNSTGDLVLFCDIDDILHKQKIEFTKYIFDKYHPNVLLHNYFKKGKDPAKRRISLSFKHYDNFDDVRLAFKNDVEAPFPWIKMLNINTRNKPVNNGSAAICHGFVSIDKKTFNDEQYDNKLGRGEDADYCVRLKKKGVDIIYAFFALVDYYPRGSLKMS